MLTLATFFAIVLALNLVPAFMPPTWMAVAFFAVYSGKSILILALTGAIAATLGRILLAMLSKAIIRNKILGQKFVNNIDVLRSEIENRKKLTVSIFLLYAFSPLPSNQLFIAYGLTGLPIALAAIPFFLGRLVSYSFFAYTSSEIANRIAFDTFSKGKFFNFYFVFSQIITLAMIYFFVKINWKVLFEEKKIRWVK